MAAAPIEIVRWLDRCRHFQKKLDIGRRLRSRALNSIGVAIFKHNFRIPLIYSGNPTSEKMKVTKINRTQTNKKKGGGL